MQQSIFITGAASGIGRATAELFVARDWPITRATCDTSRFGRMLV